jgi:hypothetical protein
MFIITVKFSSSKVNKHRVLWIINANDKNSPYLVGYRNPEDGPYKICKNGNHYLLSTFTWEIRRELRENYP